MTKNLEIAKAMYAAFARMDMNTVFTGLANDVEYIHHGEVPWAGSFKGFDGAKTFFELLGRTIEFQEYQPTEFYEDGDNIIVVGHTLATVRATGARFDNHWVNVLKSRDGKLLKFVGYDTASIAKS